MSKIKVCHFSSVHGSHEVRILVRECVSLARAGYDVYYVVKGESREENGVHIIGVGEPPKGKIRRMMNFTRKVYEKALSLDCDIYHFHDPELLPFGIKLKRLGKKVIFDSHEAIPIQIMSKEYIPYLIRGLVANLYKFYESYAVKRLDGVVAADPYITGKFRNRARRVVNVNNFPSLEDVIYSPRNFSQREDLLFYVGSVNDVRGEKIMVEAMKEVKGSLVIAGKKWEKELDYVPDNVSYFGEANRKQVNEFFNKAVAGLCLMKPIKNYYNSQPTKIYEYMAGGLPVICSNFPACIEAVEKTGSGFCVDPFDIEAVRKAMRTLLENHELAQGMGTRGRKTVEAKYSWEPEAEKLIKFYQEILQ